MSTIIRLDNVDFGNKDLPVIPRLVSGDICFSYKPSIKNGFVDHSGVGTIATQIGEPILKDIGLYCGTENGYRTVEDDVDEITAIVVFAEDIDDSNGADFMPIGNYNVDNGTGWGLFYRSGTIKGIAYANTGSARQAAQLGVLSGQWACIRVSKTRMSLFVAENGVLTETYSDADFVDRSKTPSDTIGIGAAARSTWPVAKEIVAEATMYKRALSDAEIQKAYEYSKAYFNKHTSLDI